jgi:hypothetical protein
MENLVEYEKIEPFLNHNEYNSDKRTTVNLDDLELSVEHLAKSLARIFLATHKGKIDKALDEFRTDM